MATDYGLQTSGVGQDLDSKNGGAGSRRRSEN